MLTFIFEIVCFRQYGYNVCDYHVILHLLGNIKLKVQVFFFVCVCVVFFFCVFFFFFFFVFVFFFVIHSKFHTIFDNFKGKKQFKILFSICEFSEVQCVCLIFLFV